MLLHLITRAAAERHMDLTVPLEDVATDLANLWSGPCGPDEEVRDMAEPQLAVEVDGVVKRFGRIQALDGVTLHVRRARCTGCSARTGRARPR